MSEDEEEVGEEGPDGGFIDLERTPSLEEKILVSVAVGTTAHGTLLFPMLQKSGCCRANIPSRLDHTLKCVENLRGFNWLAAERRTSHLRRSEFVPRGFR